VGLVRWRIRTFWTWFHWLPDAGARRL